MRYHALYGALGLTPAEISRFEAAVAKGMDPFGLTLGMYPAEQERDLLEGMARSLDKAVRESLGEPAVGAFRQFIATSDLRQIADKLALHTFHSDTPLTAAQADQLAQTCLECRADAVPAVRIDPRTVDWDAALNRAQSFLSPTQLNAFRSMIDLQRFDQEFNRATGLPYRRPVRNF